MEQVTYHKELPVCRAWDIIVCGAGPSGICAAVAAAREGKQVLLLERYGVLGGNLTLGNITTVMGAITSGGLSGEIDRLLESPNPSTGIDRELAKQRLVQLVAQAGVTCYLQCPVVDVLGGQGEITGLVVKTPQGLRCYAASCYVDATGDGYVAAMAGAQVMIGRDGDGLVQPVSLMYTIDGVDEACTLTCCHEEHYTVLSDGREYLALCREAERDGRLPRNVSIVRLYQTNTPGERLVNATQHNGCNPLDEAAIASAEVALHRQQALVNHFLRSEIPGFANIRVRASADTLGIRESRRIRGLVELHSSDLVAGRRFADAVVNGADFPLDIHNPSGGGQAENDGLPQPAQPYDIPMRALQPLGLRNLVIAGRCISGSHRAHASYRVMNIAMGVGQAAGCMAAEAVHTGTPVSELCYASVRARLLGQGCTLR